MAKTTFDTNPVSLQTLLKNCEDGKLQLPDFQRCWVWEDERIMSLIAQLEKMILVNRIRADFAEKFEELIESYNNGSRNIEELFEELVRLSNSLTEVQHRPVRENMSEEELVIFDILTRPAPELSAEERAEVKKVARHLLARMKELLVLNWRQKAAASPPG